MTATDPGRLTQSIPKLYILLNPASLSPEASGLALGSSQSLGPLARALASSPLWGRMPRAVLVVREEPAPALGLFGYFDQADEVRIHALKRQLEDSTVPVRYVSYSQAEQDCERLGERLSQQFGRNEMRTFSFHALPRGGLIVLGMLAYVLDLPPSQIGRRPVPNESPLVVVDDCAISGARFGQWLRQSESRQVVFATLYSHPDLRAAVMKREPRVHQCLSAHDLTDYARQTQGEGYAAWLDRWAERSKGLDYWIGQPERICFAWNEPDVGFWNKVTREVDPGWRLAPPEICLKNRGSQAQEPSRVQMQPLGKGPLRPSAAVLYAELEGQIVVGNPETDESFTLTDTAAAMWRGIVELGSQEAVSASLSRTYNVDEAEIANDLQVFVNDLLERGLLEKVQS